MFLKMLNYSNIINKVEMKIIRNMLWFKVNLYERYFEVEVKFFGGVILSLYLNIGIVDVLIEVVLVVNISVVVGVLKLYII